MDKSVVSGPGLPEDSDSSTKHKKHKNKKSKKRLLILSRLLWLTAAVLILIGIGLSIKQWIDNNNANKMAEAAVKAADEGKPSTAPATIKPTEDEFSSYQVGPALPRYLFIPRFSVKAIVRPLGITSSGQIGSPTNVFDVGWYKYSSEPGQAGAMVVDGHVSSWTTNGVFYHLKDLNVGDQIEVEKGDGSIVTYKVDKKLIYNSNNVDVNALLSPANPNKPGLNLITCTGDVISGTNEFNERVVVFTEEQS